MKKISMRFVSLIIVLAMLFTIVQIPNLSFAVNDTIDYSVDLTSLKITRNGTESVIKNYTQDEFDTFLSDYNSNSLPAIYTTEFLFDGVGMVKTPDLDDFIDEGANTAKVKTLNIKAININTTGNIQFTGSITGGMIAVNTNNVTGDINIILNGATIDTDSKKAPAIYVYNKNINYTDCKVTIKTVESTKNYINGGKLKKVSLIGSDELANYNSYYTGTTATNYATYTNYYGIYTSAQINNILFAKVKADSEDLKDGDPYYFYKAAGAISSDIDLYFEGEGELNVTSKNKEGIETKGNLTFQGGTGDYIITAEDDALNTTTSSSANTNVRNTLTINVNSLKAIVNATADEGDAIDSNGKLIINGGTITAIAHPTSQDSGIDSNDDIYINGGTVIATGNMLDQIANTSTQNYMVLSFKNKTAENDTVVVKDSNGQQIMEYKTDRAFTNLVYSSSSLVNGTYSVYKNGVQQQWSGTGTMGGGQRPEGMGEPPEGEPNGNQGTPPERPEGEQGNPPEKPEGDQGNPPEGPDGNNMNPKDRPNGENTDSNAEASVEFKITGVQNLFRNVENYESNSNQDPKGEEDPVTAPLDVYEYAYYDKLETPAVVFKLKSATDKITVKDLKEAYKDSAIKIDGKQAEETEVLKNGTKVQIDNKEYTVIIYGDTNCDGAIGIMDAVTSLNHVKGKAVLTGAAFIAGDTKNNEAIGIMDAVNVLNVVKGRLTYEQFMGDISEKKNSQENTENTAESHNAVVEILSVNGFSEYEGRKIAFDNGQVYDVAFSYLRK